MVASTVQKYKQINLVVSSTGSHLPDILGQVCQDLYSVFSASLCDSEKLETTQTFLSTGVDKRNCGVSIFWTT